MVLAAGLGTRLRPITDTVPKPLVELDGRTLLDHAIDRLALVGVERVVVNVHYKAEMVAASSPGATIRASRSRAEAELLETGGGVAQALPLLGEAFFVVNSDVFWLDGKDRCAAAPCRRVRSRAAWTRCCCCSAPSPRSAMTASGDYFLDALGQPAAARRSARSRRYLFAGIQLLHRRAVRRCRASASSR